MIKKCILPIFLLAMVVVLSVFYIKQSTDDVVNPVNGNDDTSVVSDFANKRLEILEKRSEKIDELEAVIASGTLTNSEINQTVDEINDLYYLKYTEVELEDLIVGLGYQDSLVIIDNTNVSVTIIDDELTLFSGIKEENFYSSSNRKLFVKKNNKMIQDDFNHEQNLIIKVDNKKILVSGCSHAGIINILKKAEELCLSNVDLVFGGMHLFNPPTHKYESDEYIDKIAKELNNTKSIFYTFHCTGVKAYERLKQILNNRIHYIGTGYTYSLNDIC